MNRYLRPLAILVGVIVLVLVAKNFFHVPSLLGDGSKPLLYNEFVEKIEQGNVIAHGVIPVAMTVALPAGASGASIDPSACSESAGWESLGAACLPDPSEQLASTITASTSRILDSLIDCLRGGRAATGQM